MGADDGHVAVYAMHHGEDAGTISEPPISFSEDPAPRHSYDKGSQKLLVARR